MIRALYSAASGMTAQQLNVDNIANNLANANTVGYKSRRAQFQDLLYQSMVQPGSSAGQQTVVPTGLQLGLGTRAASNEIIFQQGDFAATNNPLDLVIQGKGFFQIRRASGDLAYTRAGNFHLDRDGNVYWNNQFVDDAQLFRRLKEIAVRQPQPEVHIRGDRDGRYEFVGRVVYNCQRAGILKIGFITEPPPRSG